VLEPDHFDDYPASSLVEELRRRSSFIDGVVISGGEPTLDSGLPPLLREIKKLGLLVKLDTNGLAPKVLKEVIWEGLVDLVALDLKTSPSRYQEMHTGKVDVSRLQKSVRLLLEGPVEYEFRTTCVPGWVGEKDIRELGALIRGGGPWMLQQFVPDYSLSEAARTITPYSIDQLGTLAEIAREYVSEVGLRGL
jgi:pyruvate formate lyase activating enzyme